ncbi:MAG: cytochrome d ubiquinol oxidase subunit II [Ignavibacteriaceae bacterium]|nr:cytochrome d ubiquinol oxidase subunit II [Ignavibacteriaceae bacterium]
MEFTFDLNTTWFILIGVLFSGYAILDGFDLGVGALHLFSKGDENRRLLLNSIGPVWDGNEVWLVTGGGALFAAFPDVYATAFSGFYIPFMLLLFVLIFRAVSIEVRSKNEKAWWRKTFDFAFSFSSFFIALLMGITVGNIIQGLPIGADKYFTGSIIQMLNPYALAVGITTVAAFMMHGSIYLVMKTEGNLQTQIKGWVQNTMIFFIISYATVTVATLIYMPYMAEKFREYPVLFLIAIANMLAIANIPREISKNREFLAFLSSSVAILLLLTIFAIGLFPNFLISSINPAYSLNIYNASSSDGTLNIMLLMAIIGIPFVLAYTISIYWVFRGKVKIDSTSY